MAHFIAKLHIVIAISCRHCNNIIRMLKAFIILLYCCDTFFLSYSMQHTISIASNNHSLDHRLSQTGLVLTEFVSL